MEIKHSITALIAAMGLGLIAGCFHHHDDDHHDHYGAVDGPGDVVLVDADHHEHHGYYDQNHGWHGGYYDDQHGYHADPQDWHGDH